MFDRLMRGSVDRAMKMQPRRTQRVADELLYSSPSARDEVAAIREVGARLVGGGLTPPSAGSIAVRRSDTKVGVTLAGTDLASIDNRSLETVDLSDRSTPALAGLRAGSNAAIYAFPPNLLALVAEGGVIEPVVSDLADRVGDLTIATHLDGIRTGLSILTGRGVVATHDGPLEALARLEAAETLARITIIRQNLRRNHG